MTLTSADRLRDREAAAEEPFHMDEDAFRAFYERTARAVWVYLAHATRSPEAADDLLQETFYRFLRAGHTCATEAHRRNYVFRIATNLVRDRRRRAAGNTASIAGDGASLVAATAAGQPERRIDLSRAMAKLTGRERDLLWLAYAEGASHVEIAGALGLKSSSIKQLLFRARRRLAGLLRPSARPGEEASR